MGIASRFGRSVDPVVALLDIVDGDEADWPAAHRAVLHVVLGGSATWIGIRLERLPAVRAKEVRHGSSSISRHRRCRFRGVASPRALLRSAALALFLGA